MGEWDLCVLLWNAQGGFSRLGSFPIQVSVEGVAVRYRVEVLNVHTVCRGWFEALLGECAYGACLGHLELCVYVVPQSFVPTYVRTCTY